MTSRLLTGVLACCALFAADAPVVTFDIHKAAVERYMGLGVQWDPYEYPPTDEAWKQMYERVDHLHPAFFRVVWSATPYCSGFDDAGNPKYVWDEGDGAVEKRLTPLFRILDYAQSRGVDVMLGEWSPPRYLSGPGDPRWARIITDFVTYLTTRKHYTVIKYYNFMNEPNGNWMWPQGKVDYTAWADGMRHLRASFDAHGLKSLPIAGPDNSGDWNWIDRSAQELSPQIGLWDMHWYVKDKELVDGDIEKLLTEKREMLRKTDPDVASKGLYMGEAGVIQGRTNGDQQPRVKTFVYGVLMSDFVAQTSRAGWMGASAWDMDDAMHVVNGMEHPEVPNGLTLKIWGFWNTQGRTMGRLEDEALRPWFYTWSLMSRLFPKGARIIADDGATLPAGVRVLASTWRAGRTDEASLMIVNDADAQNRVTVRMPGKGKQALVSYHYFDEDRPIDHDGYPMVKEVLKRADLERGVTVDLPSRGVVLLTTSPGSNRRAY